MISILWAQDRPSSIESERTVVPESLENRLKNLNASNLELKSEILKLEHKVDQLQENLRNQESQLNQVISQLTTVNETTQIELTGIIRDLKVQKARNDQLEERFNASVKRKFLIVYKL